MCLFCDFRQAEKNKTRNEELFESYLGPTPRREGGGGIGEQEGGECTDKHSQQGWPVVIFTVRCVAAFGHIYTGHAHLRGHREGAWSELAPIGKIVWWERRF